MAQKKRTACDVLAEAKRAWMKPEKLEKKEVDSLAYELYEMVTELHGMAESMESRLHEYHDFVGSFKDDAVSLLGS